MKKVLFLLFSLVFLSGCVSYPQYYGYQPPQPIPTMPTMPSYGYAQPNFYPSQGVGGNTGSTIV